MTVGPLSVIKNVTASSDCPTKKCGARILTSMFAWRIFYAGS